MFDIGWSELLLIVIVAVIAIGPNQLPGVLYGLGRVFRRMQYMRFALSKQFDDFMEQNDLNQIRNMKNPVGDMALHASMEEDEQDAERRLAQPPRKDGVHNG